MKYVKLIIAFLVFFLVCIVGYSLYKTIPTETTQIAGSNEDTLVSLELSEEENTSKADSIVNFALKYLGTPYVYGSCSKDGFDCSGFVYFVFKNFNIEVPRSSIDYKTFGKTIGIDKLNKGDILVFLSPTRNEIGHLGIVTNPKGMETEFIHSTSGKEMMVILSSLKEPGYNRRFVKAIRVL